MAISAGAFENCDNLEKVLFKGNPGTLPKDYLFHANAFAGTGLTEVKFETAMRAPTFGGNAFATITGCKLIYPCAAAVGTATGKFPEEGTGKA